MMPSSRFVAFSRIVFTVGVCAIGVVFSLVPLVGWDLSRLPGDMIDSRFVGYVLEHGYLWLTGKVPSLWDAGFFYPMPRTILLSDNLIGALPFYAMFRSLAPGPEQAMVGFVSLCFLLNFAVTVWCLRTFGISLVAAALAAYPVAFGLIAATVSGHPQYLQLYPLVLCFLAFHRLFTRPSPASVGGMAASLTFLALASYYYFVFFCLLALTAVLVGVSLKRIAVRGVVRAFGDNGLLYVSLTACLMLLAINYWPYFQERLVTGSWAVILEWSPQPKAFLAPAGGSWAWGWLEPFAKPRIEGRLFPGLFPVAGLVYGLWLVWRRPDPSRALAGVLILAAVLNCVAFLDCWGPNNVLRRLPGISALRVVTRVGVVALPGLVLGLGFLLDRLLRGLSPWWRGGVLVLLLAGIVADQHVLPSGYPSYAWSASVARVDALVRRIPAEAKVFYVDPTEHDVWMWATHVDAMLAAQRLGKATYNGYSSWSPPVLSDFFILRSCAALDHWRNVAAALYRPGEDLSRLYADSAFIDFPACPPDPAVWALPQAQNLAVYPAEDRRVRIEFSAVLAQHSRSLSVTADIVNLGGRTLHGLGDFTHHYALFLQGDVLDAKGLRSTVHLGFLAHSLAPGASLRQSCQAVLPPGLAPVSMRVLLYQEPQGDFTVEPGQYLPIRMEP